MIWEKGTDRNAFIRGEVDKYTWRDVGSSFVISEITAAALYGQIKQAKEITDKRRAIYEKYVELLSEGCPGLFTLPTLMPGAVVDGHMFYLLAPSFEAKEKMQLRLSKRFHIQAFSHYVPLHASAYGSENCKVSPVAASSSYPSSTLSSSETTSSPFLCVEMARRLLRLPIHASLEFEEVQFVCECVLILARECADETSKKE